MSGGGVEMAMGEEEGFGLVAAMKVIGPAAACGRRSLHLRRRRWWSGSNYIEWINPDLCTPSLKSLRPTTYTMDTCTPNKSSSYSNVAPRPSPLRAPVSTS